MTAYPWCYPKVAAANGTAGTAFFIDTLQSAFAIGSNVNGTQGTGTLTGAVSSPVAVAGGKTWLEMYVYSATYGLDSNGFMWGTGINTVGQIGNGNVTQQSSMVQVAGGIRWKSMVEVIVQGLGVAQMTGGSNFGGIDVAGQAWMWGANNTGQLGTNVAGGATSSPVLVVGGFKWTQIATTSASSASGGISGGITTTGDAYLWGVLDAGAGGNGTASQVQSSPVLVSGGIKWQYLLPLPNATAGAGSPVMGFDVNYQLWSWGFNSGGILGQGLNPSTTGSTSSPALVAGGLRWLAAPGTWTFTWGAGINAGFNFLAIDSNFDLYGWGTNPISTGILGVGDGNPRSSPTLVVGGLKWVQVWSGSDNWWGIATTGDLYACGGNVNGQLGDGTVVAKSSPVLVAGGLKWAIGAAPKSTVLNQEWVVALTQGGQAYGWGLNAAGQNGDGASVTPHSSPVLVVGGKAWLINQAAPFCMSTDVNPGVAHPVTVSRLNATFPIRGVQLPMGPSRYISVDYDQ